jgi:hypothetical protein
MPLMVEAVATLPPYLTEAEIAEICAPLTMPAAQRRYLERLGMIVRAKPNGRPLVARGEFERVMVGRPPQQAQNSGRGPNVTGMDEWAKGRKRGA